MHELIQENSYLGNAPILFDEMSCLVCSWLDIRTCTYNNLDLFIVINWLGMFFLG